MGVRFALLPLLAILALAALTPAIAQAKQTAAPAKPPIVGIADQKSAVFGDQRFLGLGLRHARLAIAWDALRSDWQTEALDRWLHGARAAGVEPLITFDRSRLEGKGRVLPTPAKFLGEFRRFRKRYPWVRDFSTWNEANFCGQETCRHPELVARYYLAIKRNCTWCRVLGADILDLESMRPWLRRFIKVAGQPRYWGFHNYVTANRFQTQRTKTFLADVKGEVWLTETGGLVARRNKSLIKLPQGTAHAAQVTRFILRELPKLDRRLTRIYLYQWDSTTAVDTWDSSFIGADKRARPALGILKQILKSHRLPPARPVPAAAPIPAPVPGPEPVPAL